MHRVTPESVLQFRCRRSHISEHTTDIIETAHDVCGVQSQVLKAAMMSVLVRTDCVDMQDVENALWKDRTIVKTWCMRGTLHLLSSKDLPVYTMALGSHLSENTRRYLIKDGLSDRKIDKMLDVVLDALGSEPLTKKELAAEVSTQCGSETGRWIKHSWGVFLRLGCYNGSVCFGSPRGANVTFVSTDDWLGKMTDIDEKEARKRILTDYIHTYGPATPRDLSYWAGLKVSDAKNIMDEHKDLLTRVRVGEHKVWMLKEDTDLMENTQVDFIALLPYFDTYLLSHKDKSLIVNEKHYKKIYRQAGWISPTILHNGHAVGTWSYNEEGDTLEIYIEPFEEGSWVEIVEKAGERLAQGLRKTDCSINNL